MLRVETDSGKFIWQLWTGGQPKIDLEGQRKMMPLSVEW
jgi:hypothetical protein